MSTKANEPEAGKVPRKEVTLEEMLSWPKGTKLTNFKVRFPPEKSERRREQEKEQQ